MSSPDSTAPHTDAADLLDLADAPMPWPQRPGAGVQFAIDFSNATPEERPAIFAKAETEVAPDIIEWNGVLNVLEHFPDFPIPDRWKAWDLGEEMDKWGSTALADERLPP